MTADLINAAITALADATGWEVPDFRYDDAPNAQTFTVGGVEEEWRLRDADTLTLTLTVHGAERTLCEVTDPADIYAAVEAALA